MLNQTLILYHRIYQVGDHQTEFDKLFYYNDFKEGKSKTGKILFIKKDLEKARDLKYEKLQCDLLSEK